MDIDAPGPVRPARDHRYALAAAGVVAVLAAGLLAGDASAADVGPLAQRLADGRRTVRALPRSSWTVQLVLACLASNANEALDAEDIASPRFALPAAYRGAPCAQVFSGVYPTRAAAAAAAGRAPARFADAVPVRIGSLVSRGPGASQEAAPLPAGPPYPERSTAPEAEVPPSPEPVLPLQLPTPPPAAVLPSPSPPARR